LFSIVLYRVVLYRVVLYRVVLYRVVLYRSISGCSLSFSIGLFSTHSTFLQTIDIVLAFNDEVGTITVNVSLWVSCIMF